jgi:undecaprenyl phosphate N,N'-diacetylbacillosamine 1-phosphate transferase
MYRHFIKPLCDFFIALFLLIILSPIILLTAILLFLANNGKVFFFQQRPGLNSKPFKIVKFKTMRDAFDQDGVPLPDEVRDLLSWKYC